MGFVSRHLERDLRLPKHRTKLLESALHDLSHNSDVLAVYQSGSLGKGNFDQYSDIDLHIIVTQDKKKSFIINKRSLRRR